MFYAVAAAWLKIKLRYLLRVAPACVYSHFFSDFMLNKNAGFRGCDLVRRRGFGFLNYDFFENSRPKITARSANAAPLISAKIL